MFHFEQKKRLEVCVGGYMVHIINYIEHQSDSVSGAIIGVCIIYV